MEESQVDQEFEEITEFEQLPIDPKPFNLVEHKARYRRDDHCPLQHILFVLDTSGSIGEDDFNTVTTVLGSLVPLFCKPIKIAAMTFDHEYYVEFCFDEYDNSALGRYLAGEALWSIPYIRPGQSWGSRYTHTAGAAQCVCDYIFRDRGCGIGSTAAPCVDVVFFTDGHANDPVQNVCETVQCLHDIRNVNTYTISVGNPYQLKLDCMEENNLRLDEYHLFNFKSISDLENQLNLIIHRLITNPISYECASTFSDPRV